jgi:hypothetical protein
MAVRHIEYFPRVAQPINPTSVEGAPGRERDSAGRFSVTKIKTWMTGTSPAMTVESSAHQIGVVGVRVDEMTNE